MTRLDKKDYKILKELDKNNRAPFSQIAKKVGLSKNAVINRYEKRIKELITHSTTGIDNHKLGYNLIKVFYNLEYFDENIEKEMKKEFKEHKNIIWAARYYGPIDLSIGIMVKDINELIVHIRSFNERFSEIITNKRIEIIEKQYFFRHNYIHEKAIKSVQIQKIDNEEKNRVSDSEKKIITSIINEPRKPIIRISEETGLDPKTIVSRIRELERKRVITGYFPTFDNNKLGYDTFKLLIKIRSGKDSKEFERYMTQLKNIKHLRKMIGYWDYEIDIIFKTNKRLHKEIERIKKEFPKLFKKIEIASFEKRIFTGKKDYLKK